MALIPGVPADAVPAHGICAPGCETGTVHVEVTLLGRFAVTVGGTMVEPGAWRSRRAKQLVALLALAPHQRLPTERVMDALWPDLAPEAARANLHKTATLARQAMGGKESVVLRGDVVALWPAADIVVDVLSFEAAARAALGSGDARACAAAAGLSTGELLPDERYEEWTISARDRLRTLYLDLLRAGELWAELADADPTDETAHRGLMQQHLAAGRLHAAIRQFQRLRTILARELGVLPSQPTLALYQRIVGTASSGRVRAGLVGREVELVQARAALRRAAEGRPAAIFVTGPAGIGKTRLCEELIEHADGWFVLRASGREQTASLPYWPLVEAIQAALLERPDIAQSLGEAERSILVRLTGTATDRPRAPVHRHAVLHLMFRVLAAAGGTRAVLFLDDLHHIDDDTLALAEIAASAASPRGVLLVAAYRSGHDQATAMGRAMIARGIGVGIALGPLNRYESDAIVTGLGEGSHVDLDLVWELSEGNPFFALEVAAALSSDAATPAAGAHGAIDVRLERLPSEARIALRDIAVVAHEFTADEYAVLAAIDGDRALDHLEVAMAVGILARHGGNYRFRHDLVRERITATVSDGQRVAAHAAAASRLAELGVPPARVVHHLLAAGMERDALPWLRRAAADAVGVGAHADALVAVDRALAIANHDAELLAIRAEALSGAGNPGAPAAYLVAMAVAGEPARSVLAVKRAKVLILAGEVPAAAETLATVAEVPADFAGQLHVARALASWCTGDLDEAEREGLAARRLAEASGSVRDFVDATMVMAMVAHERGAWPQRLSLDMLDTSVRPDLAAVVMDAHLCIAESYLYGGVPYPEVVSFAEDLQRKSVDVGSPRAEAVATTLLGEAHLLMGDTEEAVGHLRKAVEQHRRVGILCGEALSLQRLAQAYLALGDPDRAQTALAEALTAARGSPVGTRHLLDRIHGTAIASADDPGAAVDEAERAVRGPSESCPPCSINRIVPTAIALADLGDLDRAGPYLAGAEQVVTAFFPRGGWQASLEEARAHDALARGHGAEAARLLAGAAEAFERLGQRLDAIRCRGDLESMVGAGKV